MSGLNCEQAGALISAYISGEIEASESAELETHLEACGSCKKTAAAFFVQDRALSEMAAEDNLDRISKSIGAKLRGAKPTAAAPQKRPVSKRLAKKKSSSAAWLGWALPLAACAAAALLLYRWNGTDSRSTVSELARVASISSDGVKIIRANGPIEAATVGSAVHEGDQLVIPTGAPDMALALDLSAGARLEFAADTVFEIESASSGKLVNGRLYADVAKGSASGSYKYTLNTSAAAIGIRGTKFELEVAGTTTAVRMEEGAIDFFNALGKQKVETLQECRCQSGAAPTSPAAITLDKLWRGSKGRLANAADTQKSQPEVPTNGLKLWLRSDRGIENDAGGRIKRWRDQSGSGTDAVQNGISWQPLLAPKVIQGLDAVYFDGGEHALRFKLPVNGSSELTICLVAANHADTDGGVEGGQNPAIEWEETALWGWIYLSPYQTSISYRFGTAQSGNLPRFKRPASINKNFSITTSMKRGAEEKLFVNGQLVQSETGKLPKLNQVSDDVAIGYGGHGSGFNGNIAEVLVFTRALNEEELKQMTDYLAGKYGLGAH